MSEQSGAIAFTVNEHEPITNYMERRKRAFDSLDVVAPISSLLSTELQIASRPYFETSGYQDDKLLELPDGKAVGVACADNGIMTLQTLKERVVNIEHAPQPEKPLSTRLRNFMNLQPQPFSIYDIENYYVLDRNNNTGCDLSRMWSEEVTGHKPPRVIRVPIFGNPKFGPSKDGPVLILSNIAIDVKPHVVEGVPKKFWPILNLFAHLHEIGHFLQNPGIKGKNALERDLGSMAYDYQMKKLDIDLWSLVVRESSNDPPRSKIKAIGTLVKSSKKGLEEQEAHAFSILAIHNLKQKRLNILGNVDSKTVRRFTTNVLHN